MVINRVPRSIDVGLREPTVKRRLMARFEQSASRCAFALIAVLASAYLLPCHAMADCAVVNLMPAFWHALDAADPAAQMRTSVVDPHPDLYNDNYVRLPAGTDWDNKLLRESSYDETHRREISAAEHYLAANVPGYMRKFRQSFPDYRCDFPFYIAPSFGAMDGSAAALDGRYRIIFAPDVIPRYHQLKDLKVLIDHETFHVYHHQATGIFGASEEAVPTLEASLWSEGLATYVSRRMNPGTSLDIALLQPDIPKEARPHMYAIAKELLDHLEEKNAATFARYFEGGAQPAGYPPRAGYYVGFLIAEAMSKRYTLRQMAHLAGPVLHDAITAQLQRLISTTEAGVANAQPPAVTGDAKVDRLLDQMTLTEKLTLIHDGRENPRDYQGQAGYIQGIPHLGIPGLRLADGPPGVLTRVPAQAETATMGVAATFDVALARLNGVVIGREARALGIDVSLQPFINIDRDLAMRRLYNTFGEDPLLTAAMGAATIRGIQSQGVMAVAKHFIAFDTAATDVWVDQQALHEIYAAPFEAAVQARVACIMCSYNHINGAYACGNATTLTDLLRKQLDFRGVVISDWGATHSARFMNAGLDVEMIDGPDSSGFQEPAFLGAEPAAAPPLRTGDAEVLGDLYGGAIPEEPVTPDPDETDYGAKVPALSLADALASNAVTEATITRSAGRVLSEMHRFGLLDHRSTHTVTTQSISANARIIERTAEEAAVLLKNTDDALPLQAGDLASTVLIGPTAAQVDAIGISGERSLGLPARQVGPLAALRQLAHQPDIQFAADDDMNGTPIPADAFSHAEPGHHDAPGLERHLADGKHLNPGDPSVDSSLDFTVRAGTALPPDTTATWTGNLRIEHAGRYWLYLQALGTNARLYVDGKRVAITGVFQGDVHGDILQANQDNVVPTGDGLDNVRQEVQLEAGVHAIALKISPDSSHAPVQLRLNWYPPEQRKADHAAAIEAARHARVAVVFAWARRSPAFVLPGDQDRLIEEVAAVNPNTIVVLNTSQPVALPWAAHVKSILEMWWPGDEGGWATARLLLGHANPAGRLPVTWGRRLADYPATDPRFPERSAQGVDHRTTYSEGVFVGYRWFDHEQIEPLFPFGFGLSYTRFEYSRLHVARTGDGALHVTLTIKNSGERAGDEVPQVYLGAPTVHGAPNMADPPDAQPADAAFPLRKLVAFARVHLAAGQSTTVSLTVPLRQLQYWSTTDAAWKLPAGERTLSVGSSSRSLVMSTSSP